MNYFVLVTKFGPTRTTIINVFSCNMLIINTQEKRPIRTKQTIFLEIEIGERYNRPRRKLSKVSFGCVLIGVDGPLRASNISSKCTGLHQHLQFKDRQLGHVFDARHACSCFIDCINSLSNRWSDYVNQKRII